MEFVRGFRSFFDIGDDLVTDIHYVPALASHGAV